jgi:hypothetical protein
MAGGGERFRFGRGGVGLRDGSQRQLQAAERSIVVHHLVGDRSDPVRASADLDRVPGGGDGRFGGAARAHFGPGRDEHDAATLAQTRLRCAVDSYRCAPG